MKKLSLYDQISSSLIDGGLPDDFSLPKDDETVFADGAEDGIYLYHMNAQKMSDDDHQIMIDAIDAANDHDYDLADRLFTELSVRVSAISIIDEMQDHIWDNMDKLSADNIYEYAAGMITMSDNRECVKYGLTILGLLNTDNEEMRNVIRTLALSDEFTFFCVHIMKNWKDGNRDIFETARNVHGWGRIHAVEQLRALDPLYEEIQKWLLKEGTDNMVMPFYSALTVWKNSGAGNILFNGPTYEQFTGIRKIIDALLDESAVQGLSALDKRNEIIMVFLDEAKKMPLMAEDYEVIYHICGYFEEIPKSSGITSLARQILSSPSAKEVILDAVRKGRSIDLARQIGIDVKPYVLTLLENSFRDSCHLCGYLMDSDNYRSQLLKIFRKNLDLKKMISVPADKICFTDGYDDQTALEFLMRELRRYPLQGKEFVETGLQCRSIRTRNGALTVLQNWVSELKKPLSEILPEFQTLLIMLNALEPCEAIRERMEGLIAGKVIFDVDVSRKKNVFAKETLDILCDAISDIGSWCWWYTDDDAVQLEFCNVQLYDDSREEKQPHSSVIALRFEGNPFAVFLDNIEDDGRKWYEKLRDDQIDPFPVETYELAFNDPGHVNELLESYRNRTEIRQLVEEDIVTPEYILGGKCYDVGFIAGGDRLVVLTHEGPLAEEKIEDANRRWWQYWQDYWKKRNTKDAYEKDGACEATIPVNADDPQGNYSN